MNIHGTTVTDPGQLFLAGYPLLHESYLLVRLIASQIQAISNRESALGSFQARITP